MCDTPICWWIRVSYLSEAHVRVESKKSWPPFACKGNDPLEGIDCPLNHDCRREIAFLGSRWTTLKEFNQQGQIVFKKIPDTGSALSACEKKVWIFGSSNGTVGGRNPANHLGCIKPCRQWDFYHQPVQDFFHQSYHLRFQSHLVSKCLFQKAIPKRSNKASLRQIASWTSSNSTESLESVVKSG